MSSFSRAGISALLLSAGLGIFACAQDAANLTDDALSPGGGGDTDAAGDVGSSPADAGTPPPARDGATPAEKNAPCGGAGIRMRSPSTKRVPGRVKDSAANALRANHLRREVKTAIELAVASMSPTEIVDRLAVAAGLLEALAEFPADAAPVVATGPRALALAEQALEAWHSWEAKPGRKGLG